MKYSVNQLFIALIRLLKTGKNNIKSGLKSLSIAFSYVSGIRILPVLGAILLSFPGLNAATYRSVSNGNWSSGSTWQGSSVPPTTLAAGDSILIRHTVTYNGGNNLEFNGVLIIQPLGFSTAQLNVISGKNIEVKSGARMIVINGAFRQNRFASGNDGQPYSGNSPGASPQSGNFVNNGGYIHVVSSYIEVAQNWSSENGGIRSMTNACLYTGQNYNLSGSGSSDTLNDVNISVGWHGSGNFEVSDATISFQEVRIQIAGTGGHFKLNSGRAFGDIDYIFLRNQIVPFTGSGNIEVSSSVNNSPSLNLDAYCAASSSNLIHNSKFSGTRSLNCGLNYFPGDCNNGGLVLLSISLLDFMAKTNRVNQIDLNWSTESEKNNVKFEIERSLDGVNWQLIGEVKGAGNSDILLNYVYTDKNPNQGSNFYRLKSVDNEGLAEYSLVKHVLLNQASGGSVSIYPNPANNVLNVTLPAASEEYSEISLSVEDSRGIQILTTIQNVDGLYMINTEALSSGVYFLKMNIDGVVSLKTFSIVK